MPLRQYVKRAFTRDMRTTSTFRYDALPAPTSSTEDDRDRKSTIRLLHLQPGAFKDDIHVRLEQAELNFGDPIEYEALSYTWGTMEQSGVVYLGHDKEFTLQVTDNLAVALRHLRHKRTARTMWIDALCIDQSNLGERGVQVSIMAEIYRLAKAVIVWLGPEKDRSNYALDVLRDLGPKVERDPDSGAVKMSQANWNSWRGVTNHDSLVLIHLFERPWFDRLWIRQEIFFGQEKATVQVGRATISWNDFCHATLFLWENIVLMPRLNVRLTALHELFYNAPADIATLRARFGAAKCSDKRDRIFAVMNMLVEPQNTFVGAPDYNLSASEIWKKTILAFIKYYQEVGPQAHILGFLDECFSREPFDSPSWIPKWEVDTAAEHHRTLPFLTLSGGPFSAKVEHIPDGDILRILGLRVQTVESAYRADPDKSWVWTVKELFDNMRDDQEYPTGQDLMETCAWVFTGGFVMESTDPPRSELPTLADIAYDLDYIYCGDNEDIAGWIEQNSGRTHYNVLSDCIQGRSIITTRDGYIGLGPRSTEGGDLIVAFVGRHSLTMLRQSTANASQYRIVGTCFVQGFMSSEAFLGPLPPLCRHVGRTLPDDMYQFIEVYDEGNKAFLPNDPRLKSLTLLPIEQEKMADALEKRAPYLFDMDIDRLRGMNMDVEYFNIV